MNEIAAFCKELKKKFQPEATSLQRPVRCWSEKDLFQGSLVDAFVIILRTQGCSWARRSGCSMCGYFNDSAWKHVSDNKMLLQFQTAMQQFNGEKMVKLFTSGSFLDEKEISDTVQKKILSDLAKTTAKISIESRPEYITASSLASIKSIVGNTAFEIGIGLETANDIIRNTIINKGFTFQDYRRAASLLKKHKFKLKTYVLIKPPFLTEQAAINDSINTVQKIKTMTDTISFNPTNVQKNTLVDYLWRRKYYRPPWLWSIVEILQQSKKETHARLKCDIAGGGMRRGAHNCKNCDSTILSEINEFSLTQDSSKFHDQECSCKQTWHDQLELEYLTFGSFVDFNKENV